MPDPVIAPVVDTIVAPIVPPVAAPASWFEGAAPEDVGYLQNRGWDKLPARDAALAAGKAHREAEKLIGAPAEKIVRLPNDANDVEGWRQVQRRLGAPADEKGYDFSTIKHADGTALDANTSAAWAKRALDLGLTPAKATELMSALVREKDGINVASTQEAEAKLAVERDTLTKNWGTNFEANKFVAQQAAAKLGVTPVEVAALEKVVGYARVMEMFRNVGSKIGEDRFVTSPAPGGGAAPMTREQAVDRKGSLMKDETWVKAYLGGDAEKAREMTALNRMIVG